MTMKKNKISWLICLLCSSLAYGQEFTYEATLDPVTESAYYKIALSPMLLGKLRTDHSDLRIYDNDGIEQPYLLRQEIAISSTSLFKEYEILEKNYKEDAISYLTFHNPEKNAIDNVSFIVKNTDVQKRARLSGSDDQKNWYVIKDNYLLHAMHSTDSTSELKILNFPLSDYAYFRLEINDNWKLPINILKVGYYDTEKIKGAFTLFDYPIASQKDSLKTSYIKLVLPELMYLEKLKFEVSGADYYSRYTNVFSKQERINRKKKKEVYFESIGTFDLNSNSRNEIIIKRLSTQELYVKIYNKDNQPLTIENVTGSYLNKYVVVKLKPQGSYTFKFGNQELKLPDYDLTAFADKIPYDISKINHKDIIRIKPIEDLYKEASVLDNPYFIWSIIGVVGIVLGLVSIRMIKEIGKKD